MKRRLWIVTALAWCGCGRPPRSPESLLPGNLAGWTRQALSPVPPSQAVVVRAFVAAYQGGGKISVELYEAKSSASAFEMTQHWREAANSVAFDKGVYFAVVRWEQADRRALGAFLRALQQNLGD